MSLSLSLPTLESRPPHPPETRPQKVADWLAATSRRGPVEAARIIGDALAATNRVAVADARRLELAERYWEAAQGLWPLLERIFTGAPHPLTGEALEAAKAAQSLSHELCIAYKHLLVRETERKLYLGGARNLLPLVHRCLVATSRTLTNSYLAYAPVPAKTWLDVHAVYAYARDRGVHQQRPPGNASELTPEQIYVQLLLLALANPYGFMPGQLYTVQRYVQAHVSWAKLTDVPPVHRMAKAVAIIPVGHDFPPFSANKGGTIDGNKLFLLTFDLAFEIQEQLKNLESGRDAPPGIGRDTASRREYITLLRRLLRQWAIPPARQFNRVPSRARVVMCAGLAGVWQYSRGSHDGVAHAPSGLPGMTTCQVMNHTPAGYALRQVDAHPTAVRIGDLIALKVEGRSTLQVAMVRWFRNTMKTAGLEFGCELLSEQPEAAAALPEGAVDENATPAVLLPDGVKPGALDTPPARVAVPSGLFGIEQAVTLKRGRTTGFAVLTKLIDQGPGFELYEFVPVT